MFELKAVWGTGEVETLGLGSRRVLLRISTVFLRDGAVTVLTAAENFRKGVGSVVGQCLEGELGNVGLLHKPIILDTD